MRGAGTIAWKDLKQRLRDRSALILGVLAPLGLALIFSLLIPDFSGDEALIAAAVVDEDGGPVAMEFVDDVLPSIDVLDVLRVEDTESARRLIERGDVAVAFVVPQGFSAAVTSGRPAELRVIGDVDAQISTETAAAIAEFFASRVEGVQVAVAAAAAAGTSDLTAVVERAARIPDPVRIVDATTGSKVLDPNTFFAAGMAIFFLFFTVQFGVASLIEERTVGTMARLLAAPIRRSAVIAGKGLAAFAVGVLAMIVLITASGILLGANWGDPVGLAVLVVAAVLSAMGVMALIAAFARTPDQATNFQSIVAVVLGLLGGTFFPVPQALGVLANLSLATPHGWFMRGVGELASGSGVGGVVGPSLAILAFAVVTMALAAGRLRAMVSP